MAILTLTDIKTFLGETSSQWDSVLGYLNDATFTFLQRELGCDIIRQDYENEMIRPLINRNVLIPKNYPIISVASLTDSDGNVYNEGTDFFISDYVIRNYTSLYFPVLPWWPWWPNRTYYLSYTAGWDVSEISDLKQVNLELIATALKPYKDKGWGESSRSFPDGSITKREEFQLNPYQQAVLNHYRRPVL
jgi:hypothetical protein